MISSDLKQKILLSSAASARNTLRFRSIRVSGEQTHLECLKKHYSLAKKQHKNDKKVGLFTICNKNPVHA